MDENVCPNLQEEGTTLKNSNVVPSTRVSLNDILWFRRSMLACQFAPQFRCMGIHVLVLDPLTHAAFTSPLPPTFDIITMLKFDCPLNVNLTPPFLLQLTL